MNDPRPQPESFLTSARAESAARAPGQLRIFFGYAAGVGKTYAMLQAAQLAARDGREVVVGYVEPHARPETQRLVQGLEQLPVKRFTYRGVELREFDMDAALARRPELLLVDELAHTNVPGSRHEKRWQDIEELLLAGIHVWSTLNVQHIESLNDVIAQITGVLVRETVPDRIFDAASELELVDITPEKLIDRLSAGKIYIPDQAQRALQAFFQRSNLTALRELSLRQTARRVHTDVELARRERAVQEPWATADRLLVCVGPSPTTARVIRTAKRMAAALDAPWLAVSVNVTGEPLGSASQQVVAEHFQLAERLGAETMTIGGQSVSEAILDLAQTRNVTKIFIGKTHQPSWRRFLFRSYVDEIVERSGPIDVYVIHGEAGAQASGLPTKSRSPLKAAPLLHALLNTTIAAWVAHGLRYFHVLEAEANAAMVFLAAVAWTAYRQGRGAAAFASLLAVLIFDFFFVPPYFTFAIADVQYLVTFAVMLAIGLVIGTLTSRLRSQVESTRERERHTRALFELGKQLNSLYGRIFLTQAAGKRIGELFPGDVAIYLRTSAEGAELSYGLASTIAQHNLSEIVAKWVIDNRQPAGAGTNTLPNAVAFFLPVIGSQEVYGAIALTPQSPNTPLPPDQRQLLEACANQLALALERDALAISAAEARIVAETEELRSSLLSSVSHDLKTPLASIAGASSSLLAAPTLDEHSRRILLETVAEEAQRLNRLLENVLQMSKLDAGAVTPSCQWHVLEEILGTALQRTRSDLAQHSVHTHLPADLPLIFVDGLLLEQFFVNLLENAGRHTPAGTNIWVTAVRDGNRLRVTVADDGPGLPSSDTDRVFDKFYRAKQVADGTRGSGLGLAICRAIAKIHGGSVVAANRPGGGCEFVLRLPLNQEAPRVPMEV